MYPGIYSDLRKSVACRGGGGKGYVDVWVECALRYTALQSI